MRTVAGWIVLAACGHTSSGVLPDGSGSGGSNHDGAIDASPICGTRAGMRGKTNRMVNAGGLDRTYIVYLPDVSPTEVVPLVFVHHGYTMSGQNMYDVTGYTTIADREHVAVAFPDGQGGPNSLGAPWNVGDNVCASYEGVPPDATGDDFAFLDAMKADIEQDQCLDSAHMFVTGFSMGGYFSHHVGCERADIAGVAPHSGGTHDLDACPVAKKPIIMFHGASDAVIPTGCDDPNANPPAEGAAAARWAVHNGCAATTTSHAVNNGTCVLWDGCPAGGQVELCTFNNMGHCWAGGIGVSLYACNGYESATELEWSFWKQYAW
jgi:polyhydroxybutyrate depolymerase